MYKRSINIHYFPRKVIIAEYAFLFHSFLFLFLGSLLMLKVTFICYHKRIAHGYVHISYYRLYTRMLMSMFIYVSNFIHTLFFYARNYPQTDNEANKQIAIDWMISCLFWIDLKKFELRQNFWINNKSHEIINNTL